MSEKTAKVYQRVVERKLRPIDEKTKFVVDVLLDMREKGYGATINDNVINTACSYLHTFMEKKKLQIEDDLRYRREIKQENLLKEIKIEQLSLI